MGGFYIYGVLWLKINSLNSSLTASDDLKFRFGKDGDGNYGYYGADGSLIPFSNINKLNLVASLPGDSSWAVGSFALTYNKAKIGRCYVLKNDNEMLVTAQHSLTGADVLIGDYLDVRKRDNNDRTYVFYLLKATSETIEFRATSGYHYGGALGLYEIS